MGGSARFHWAFLRIPNTGGLPHRCFFFFFTHDIHILLLQRSRENWELMQYSSLMTKFSDTAHLRDKIQVWRKIELLGKFWENQEKKLKGGKTEFAAVSCFHTHVCTHTVYYTMCTNNILQRFRVGGASKLFNCLTRWYLYCPLGIYCIEIVQQCTKSRLK